MCLESKTIFPKRAKEDIICYKVLDANMVSPYKNFQYDFKLYKANGITSLIIDIIRNLFKKIKSIPLCSTYHYECYNTYSRGLLHSYRKYEFANTIISYLESNNKRDFFVYKATIPKGTYYYEGYFDIASRKLQIVERLN